MSNRLYLLVLTGLAALTVLLCLILVWRESSNASRIRDLQADLRIANEREEERNKQLALDLTKMRDDITVLQGSLKETRTYVAQTGKLLNTTRAELKTTTAGVNKLERIPWLKKPGRNPPWASAIDAINKKVQLIEMRLSPPPPKPGGP